MSTALRVKRLLRFKRLIRTRYGFARKATYALEETYADKVRIFRLKRLMLQDLSLLFSTWQWQLCGSQMLLRVLMTTRLSIWWFFERPDSSPRRICPSDAMFCIFSRILTSDWVFLIRRPGGSVPVMRCSVFLRGSWLPIGSSWFVAPENLSQWFDVPSFCEDIDFRLGRLVFRVPLSVWFQRMSVPFWLLRNVNPVE